VNPYVLPYGAVVEITIDNHDDAAHPFHLHGHNFQVIDRSSFGNMFPSSGPYSTPMRRDTIQVQSQGYAVIRFVADNPGISLFHCHIEWHVESGLTATFIEAPTQLQAMKLTIPASHKSACSAQGIAMTGNAAGNTADYTNTTGVPTTPDPNPWG
jgi:iron transport multicopper oxidase